MAYEVVMPRLGWNMETGALSSWRKHDGEFVNAGDILFEVESDKAVQEVEALESGILHIPHDSPTPGQVVPVGTPLAYLLQPGEALPEKGSGTLGQTGDQERDREIHSIQREMRSLLASGSAPIHSIGSIAIGGPVRISEAVPTISGQTLGSAPTSPGRKAKPISPRAARIAAELGVDWSNLEGSGRTGRIIERDVRQAAFQVSTISSPDIQVSPLARRLAEEVGLDLTLLAARMPGKRIERTDVESAIRAALKAAANPSEPPTEKAEKQPFTPMVQPVSSIRRLTADRLAASAHSTAAVTLTTEADATELVRLRRQLKDDEAAQVPTYTDLMVCLTAHALVEHPHLNAHFEGDMNHRSVMIVQPGVVNMGIAVDTARGLLVAVLPDAQMKSLRQISVESQSLIEKARSGRINPDEMTGGTFTITNLGMYEIDAFTPIINLPECAVLGVGRIMPKQVVVDADTEQVAIRHMISLSLTFDHRLVDGAPAARFLQRIKHLVEQPYLWLGNR